MNWYTSDLHFMHEKVAGVRGFETVDEHDRAIARTLQGQVRDDDQLWILGDLGVKSSKTGVNDVLSLLRRRVPGHKHLIAGNHDPIHPMFRDSHSWSSVYASTFASVQPFARKRFARYPMQQDVMLSHFPYTGDRGPDRHVQYRLIDGGVPILHGHLHSSEIITRSEWQNSLQIHVGWDTWHRAVSHDEITSILEENA
jgi:calcineurin-like phosphoesterase family protein